MKFALAWVLSSLSLAVAAALLGTHMSIGTSAQTVQDKIIPVAIVGLVFMLVNMFVAPVVKVLSLPFIVITLGLFLLVINALLLLLTEWISAKLPVSGAVPFEVDGFWWAVLGAVVVSIVNAIFGSLATRLTRP